MQSPSIPSEDVGRIADRLTVILGLAGLLKDGAFGAVTERQKHALQETIETSEELRVLLLPILHGRDSGRRFSSARTGGGSERNTLV
jgi:hypothetical protein